MSIVINFVPFVEITLFNRSFTVRRLVSSGGSAIPWVVDEIADHCDAHSNGNIFLWAETAHDACARNFLPMFSWHFAFEKPKGSVPSSTPDSPCASMPTSFPKADLQVRLRQGCFSICLYLKRSPVSWSSTAPAISHQSWSGYSFGWRLTWINFQSLWRKFDTQQHYPFNEAVDGSLGPWCFALARRWRRPG